MLRTDLRGADSLHIALLLWSGRVGGAERVTVALVKRLRELGHAAGIVFVADSGALGPHLISAAIPHLSLGFPRGRHVLSRPTPLAAATARIGRDAAIVVSTGFLGFALRRGGYSSPVIGVEHGASVHDQARGLRRRAALWVNRWLGAKALDAEIAVSEFVRSSVEALPGPKRRVRIYNGVDTHEFSPSAESAPQTRAPNTIKIGFAARLVREKGLRTLLDACDSLQGRAAVEVFVAGEGPEREALQRRFGESARYVKWRGHVDQVVDLWRAVDVAAIPTVGVVEAFGMTAIEAMSCGIPVLASRNGGLAEIVRDGTDGFLHEPGNSAALARSIEQYARDPELRIHHGRSARTRVLDSFSIERTADSYISLIHELRTDSRRRAIP